MRNLLKALVVFAAVAPVTAFAATMLGGPHDLSVAGVGGNAANQICIYCHTPHNALKNAQAALWNRKDPTVASGFATNATTVKGTQLPAAGSLGAYSKMCMSCHDGTTAFANVMNGALTGPVNMNSYSPGAKQILGTDLTGNHPVSVPYPSATATVTYNGITRTALAGFVAAPALSKLYGAAGALGVECGSCHDPHNLDNGKFLRASNVNSALCLDCHAK